MSTKSINILNKFVYIVGLHAKTKFIVQLSVYTCIPHDFTPISIKCSGECNQQTYSQIAEAI